MIHLILFWEKGIGFYIGLQRRKKLFFFFLSVSGFLNPYLSFVLRADTEVDKSLLSLSPQRQNIGTENHQARKNERYSFLLKVLVK